MSYWWCLWYQINEIIWSKSSNFLRAGSESNWPLAGNVFSMKKWPRCWNFSLPCCAGFQNVWTHTYDLLLIWSSSLFNFQCCILHIMQKGNSVSLHFLDRVLFWFLLFYLLYQLWKWGMQIFENRRSLNVTFNGALTEIFESQFAKIPVESPLQFQLR